MCPSLTTYVYVCPLCVVVCSCMIPARIMRLVGASCLGLRLGINPTDGASLGSQLCIWWPGGDLANGAHAHPPNQPINHTKCPHARPNLAHSFVRGSPHFIMNQGQLILSGLPWPMLTGLFWRVCFRTCVSGVYQWQGPQSEEAGCRTHMPHALSPPIDPVSPPPRCKTDSQTDPCYSTHTPLF